MSNSKTVIVNIDRKAAVKLTFVELMWYQHVHDKDYHHDIFVMPTMRRIQHLVNHISKYHRRNFNETNMERTTHLYKDTLACIFSIAGTLGYDIGKGVVTGGVIQEITVPRFDNYAVYNHMTDALDNMTKAIEGFDHIENLNYRGILQENLITLLHCTLQMFAFGVCGRRKIEDNFCDEIEELIKQWYDNLESIKGRHAFNDYFSENHSKCKTYTKVRRAFNLISTKD